MSIKEIVSRNLHYCVPSDTAQAVAKVMKAQGIGALPVVSDSANRRLEGIVTDRDLCCSVVADATLAEETKIAEVMTRNPVICTLEDTLDVCAELMQKHQVRRLPVTDKQGRCIGMIAQADIALHGSAGKVAKTVAEISRPVKPRHKVKAAAA